MLKNHKLLIDKDCPMCKAYGNAFTKYDWVDKETIAPYQVIDDVYFCNVDAERATKEIALLDVTGKKVHYGIDAMLKIFLHNLPFFTPLLDNKWVKKILRQLYMFITYNRKVIAPAKGTVTGRVCDPGVIPIYR